MYPDISLSLSLVFMGLGLWLVSWSADKFIVGASGVARILGISPFVIGMVIIGFGTSAPELCVSALSGLSGHSDLSLGNAYGSCTFNIAVILGVAALIHPIKVKPSVVFAAVPVLVLISLLSCLLVGLGDGFSRMDGLLQLGVFAILLPLYCWYDQKGKTPRRKSAEDDDFVQVRVGLSVFWLVFGLLLLVGSSHILVWGAVDLARALGVSELLIGLTIVAVGTSLPELASAVASARRGKHEFVLGNIIGSNFFNTLAVVGVAGSIQPFRNVSPYLLSRDLVTMIALSLSIAVFGCNFRAPRRAGRINRTEAVIWLLVFAVYTTLLLVQELHR